MDLAVDKPGRAASLFRSQAVEAAGRRWHGQVLLVRPLSFSVWVAAAVLILAALTWFSVWATYSRRVAVVGRVQAQSGVATVMSTAAGTVAELLVEEGQEVRKGDRLLTIDAGLSNRAGPLGEQLERQIKRQIELEWAGLKQREAVLDVERRSIELAIEQLDARRATLAPQLELYDENVEILESDVDNAASLLEHDLVVRSVYSDKLSGLMRARTSQLSARSELEQLGYERRAFAQKLEKIRLDRERERRSTELYVSKLEQELLLRDAAGSYTSLAPREGVVSTLLVKPAEFVGPGQELLSIVSESSRWEAVVYVPSRAIGEVAVGQHVYLKYDAFPYQKYGAARGTVASISRTILSGRSLPEQFPGLEPSYRVIVSLAHPSVQSAGASHPLQSGMTLSAEVVVETRSLAGWLLGPLRDIELARGGAA